MLAGLQPIKVLLSNAASELELDPGSISECCHEKIQRTGQYEFQWAEATEEAVLPGEEWRDVVLEE